MKCFSIVVSLNFPFLVFTVPPQVAFCCNERKARQPPLTRVSSRSRPDCSNENDGHFGSRLDRLVLDPCDAEYGPKIAGQLAWVASS